MVVWSGDLPYPLMAIFEVTMMNIAQNVCVVISRSSSKIGLLGSKTRSLGQIKGKPC